MKREEVLAIVAAHNSLKIFASLPRYRKESRFLKPPALIPETGFLSKFLHPYRDIKKKAGFLTSEKNSKKLQH